MSDANSPQDSRTMTGRRTVIAGMGAAGLVASAGRFSIARAARGPRDREAAGAGDEACGAHAGDDRPAADHGAKVFW